MSEVKIIFVSSVFPKTLGTSSVAVANFEGTSSGGASSGSANWGGTREFDLTGLPGLCWMNPGFSERFLQQCKLDPTLFFTPAEYQLSEKEAEAFYRSLEGMNSDSNVNVKTLWGQEFSGRVESEREARAEKAALGNFVASGGQAPEADFKATPAAQNAEQRRIALSKAQQFLVMAFFLEKTQSDIQSVMKQLAASRGKMDEALGFLATTTRNEGKVIGEQSEKGLDDLHTLSSSLPDAQDFYGLVRETADTAMNKPDWRLLLSALVAFAPPEAVLLAQDKELEKNLRERGIWDAPETQFQPAPNCSCLDALKIIEASALNPKILKISLAEVLGLTGELALAGECARDVVKPWLNSKRIFMLLADTGDSFSS